MLFYGTGHNFKALGLKFDLEVYEREYLSPREKSSAGIADQYEQFLWDIPSQTLDSFRQGNQSQKNDRAKTNSEITAQELALLAKLPFEEVLQPFIISTNSNNTLIRMKNGHLLELENIDAKKVYDFFLSQIQETTGPVRPQKYNTMTLYLNPRHAFLGLDCTSCANGNSYNNTFGLYPNPLYELTGTTGIVVNEENEGLKSAVNPNFRTTFYITDKQAFDILQKKKSEEKKPKYNLLDRNCVDFAMEFGPVIGEPNLIDFLPNVQMTLNPNEFMNSAAHSFTILKYKIKADQDHLIMGYVVTSFVISYIAVKTFRQLSNFFSKSKSPVKPSLTINMGKAALMQSASILAIRTAIGPNYPQFMQFIRLAAIAIPAITVAKEIQSAEPLNKHQKPSLWNKKISLYLGLHFTAIASQISMKCAEIVLGEQLHPKSIQVKQATQSIGSFLFAVNTLRNFYHEITEAPCLDGMDLR